MKNKTEPMWQKHHLTEPSIVVESDLPLLEEEEILNYWGEERMAKAEPEQFARLPIQKAGVQQYFMPNTFVPPYINYPPYSAICKVYYERNGVPHVASGWIVHGDTGIKGIITSGHVVYYGGKWASNYMVLREYSQGGYAERFTGSRGRTLKGWLNGTGQDWFWDIGAILPTIPIPGATPSLPAVWNYNYNQAPYNYYFDIGYPAKPANGYPFYGDLMWESDGALINAHWHNDQIVLQANNAMEQGSSGSPWLVNVNNNFYVAGVQSTGWDGTPSSYSPYFDQRNIVTLLRDINVLK